MSFESNQPPLVGAKAPLIGAFTLGFAFGAFFDGILLHQVLQWHHLLSLVQGDLYRDIRVQILADGLFHAAAYLLATGGLVLLWGGGRARPADRIVLGWAVLGFAAWQFADVTLVHWAIGPASGSGGRAKPSGVGRRLAYGTWLAAAICGSLATTGAISKCPPS